MSNEHLFCKYYVRLFIGNAIKGFATYGCCYPCLSFKNTFTFPCTITYLALYCGTNKRKIAIKLFTITLLCFGAKKIIFQLFRNLEGEGR